MQNSKRLALAIGVLATIGCGKDGSRTGEPTVRTGASAKVNRVEASRVVHVNIGRSGEKLTETSFCLTVREGEPCVDYFVYTANGGDTAAHVFQVSEGQVMEVVEDYEFKEALARSKEVANAGAIEELSFKPDLEKIAHVLRLEFFYSIYRCRTTPAVREAKEFGSLFKGNLLFKTDARFELERRSNLIVGLEFDRASQRFLGAAIFTAQNTFQVLEQSSQQWPNQVSWSIVVNVPKKAVRLTGDHLPHGFGFSNLRSRCAEGYHEFLHTPDSPWGGSRPRRSDLEEAQISYLPLVEPRLENDPEFKVRADTVLSHKLADALIDQSAFIEYDLNAFTSLERFPAYRYDNDPLWSEHK